MPQPGRPSQTYEARGVICRQHEPADRLFVLRSGAVGVYVNRCDAPPSDAEILEHGLRVCTVGEPGSLLGEAGLFLQHRTASLVAEEEGTEVETSELQPPQVRELILRQPDLGFSLCRSLAFHMRGFSDQLQAVAALVEEIHRARDNLAHAFFQFVRRLEKREIPGAAGAAAGMARSSDLFRRGETVHEQRMNNTRVASRDGALRRGREQHFREGAVICGENARGSQLYIIREGEVTVKVRGSVLATLGPGELLGEVAVLLRENPYRTAALVAASDVTLTCLGRDEFERTARQRPAILVTLAETLARRLESTNLFIRNTRGSLQAWLDRLAGGSDSAATLAGRMAARFKGLPRLERQAEEAEAIAAQARRARDRLDRRVAALCPDLAGEEGREKRAGPPRTEEGGRADIIAMWDD